MSDDKRASGRSRTKIERLTGEEKKEKAAEVFGEGAGDALGDVEAVSLYINKIKSDHDLLKGLHMVLYNRPGTVFLTISLFPPPPLSAHTHAQSAICLSRPSNFSISAK